MKLKEPREDGEEKMQMLHIYRVKQQQIKGTALDLLAGVFTRVGINVNVEGVDGICLAFYRLFIILQRVFSVVALPSLSPARRYVAPWWGCK